MVILEFGCGNSKSPGVIGVDFNPRTEADVIHNMDVFPYPFEDNYADKIICHNVLEHVDDFIAVIEEIWRIGKPDCILEFSGPFMSSVNYFSDPTHKRAFTSRSFDYFINNTDASRYDYSICELELSSVVYDPEEMILRKGINLWILKWANNHKIGYENRYAFIYPVYQIHFELRVKK